MKPCEDCACENCGDAGLLHKCAGMLICTPCRRDARAEFRLYVERATAGRKVSRDELRAIMRDF